MKQIFHIKDRDGTAGIAGLPPTRGFASRGEDNSWRRQLVAHARDPPGLRSEGYGTTATRAVRRWNRPPRLSAHTTRKEPSAWAARLE